MNTLLKSTFVTLWLALLVYGCATKNKNTDEEEFLPVKKTLRKRMEIFNDAFQKGEVEKLRSMITENYQHTNGNSRAIGKTEWLNYLQKRKKEIEAGRLVVDGYEMDETQIELWRNTAIVTAKITVSFQREVKRQTRKYRVTNLWIAEDGVWKRAGFHNGKIE